MLRLGVLLTVLASACLVYEGATSRAIDTARADVPAAGFVSPAPPMLEPRSGHTATLLQDGKVLIAGGMRRNWDYDSSAELYDPTTRKFHATGAMSVARLGHAAVLLRSGKVLVVGGWVGRDGTDTAELYDPATGKFGSLPRMTARRGRPNAMLLRSGDVLITGGADHDAAVALASAEIFRASLNRFEAAGPMHLLSPA